MRDAVTFQLGTDPGRQFFGVDLLHFTSVAAGATRSATGTASAAVVAGRAAGGHGRRWRIFAHVQRRGSAAAAAAASAAVVTVAVQVTVRIGQRMGDEVVTLAVSGQAHGAHVHVGR